jgi:hypothetical protein
MTWLITQLLVELPSFPVSVLLALSSMSNVSKVAIFKPVSNSLLYRAKNGSEMRAFQRIMVH